MSGKRNRKLRKLALHSVKTWRTVMKPEDKYHSEEHHKTVWIRETIEGTPRMVPHEAIAYQVWTRGNKALYKHLKKSYGKDRADRIPIRTPGTD